MKFTVDGPVVTWKRAASAGRRRFTSGKHADYKARLGYAALAARPSRWPLDKRYSVRIAAWTDGRADLDNVAKMVLDALNTIAWDDDRQVDSLSVLRVLSKRTDGHLEVSVSVMPEGAA